MDTKHVPFDAGIGISGTAEFEEKDGIRYVKSMQLLGVSIIAAEQVVDENTRVEQSIDAPFYDPHQPLHLEKDKPPRGYCGGTIQILDDFAFWPRGSTRIPVMTHESHPFLPEMSEEEMLAKLDALGISRNILSIDIPSTAEIMQQMRQEESVLLIDVLAALPFGTGITGVIHKRSFDYELIGGV